MRILIAEDDFTSRNMLEMFLKKQGHEVAVTANGQEALQIMQKPDAPKLAILDWMMPQLDGLEVVRRVRSTQSSEPPYLILLTARGGKADIITGLDAGANDYLTKPFDLGELRARIEVGMRMIETQEQLAAKVRELSHALEHIKTLEGILPICSFCKKIRNDQGYWDQVEAYISRRSDARFSHSICPKCMKLHYPEICKRLDDKAGEKAHGGKEEQKRSKPVPG